jgi:AcrR family transcriptional regulator
MARKSPSTAGGRRPGRRPGESRTREAIRAAARAKFGEYGFEPSMRSIARAADVDPALVLHYYSSKEELFADAMEWPFDFDEAVATIASGRRSEWGLRMASFFLSVWDDPARRDPVIGILRAATTSDHAAELLRQSLGGRLLGPIGARLGAPDAALRMSLCASQLVGLGIARHIVRLEPLASMTAEEAARAVAPTLQRYMTGKLDR